MSAKYTLRNLPQLFYSEGRYCKSAIRSRSRCTVRSYATQKSLGTGPAKTPRKLVTVLGDNGKVQWKDLSIREKAARTTQQSFNLGVIVTGLLMTGGVAYLLYTEVFSSDSKTRQFNRAVDRIRADSRVKEVLGSDSKIRAFGEPTSSRWARAGPIASTLRRDSTGAEHFQMHFNVEGSMRSGVVKLYMIRTQGQTDFEYKYLALDVQGD
ncbi:mitochondrial import inner membrane translocase subunit tim21 [Peltigera leucophlebia]|nr:mitochondrial import inner membrane translocase subunit tim21 [Peltigera leucophlebia]